MITFLARRKWHLFFACISVFVIIYASCSKNPSGPELDSTAPILAITSPLGTAVDTATVLHVTGVCSDNRKVAGISWSSSTGASGSVSGNMSSWSFGAPLSFGDQEITVTARDESGNSTSSKINVIRNHYFLLSADPFVLPSGVVTNTPSQIRAYAALDPYSTWTTGDHALTSVSLVSIDQTGLVVSEMGTLTDDGNLSNGDEIQGDGVYSLLTTSTFDTPGILSLRIRVVYSVGGSDVTDFSPILGIRVAENLTQEKFIQISQTVSSGFDFADSLLQEGDDLETVAQKTTDWLQSSPSVARSGKSGTSTVWFESPEGIKGDILLNPQGTRGGNTAVEKRAQLSGRGGLMLEGGYAWETGRAPQEKIESNNVIIYDAFNSQFAPDDEGPYLRDLFSNSECPIFSVDYYIDDQCSVNLVNKFSSYGTVILVTHGGIHDAEVLFLSREEATADAIAAHKADLTLGNISISSVEGTNYFSILPGYISNLGTFKSSVIYSGSCESDANATMRNAFLDNGALVYLGFTKIVNSDFAQTVAQDFFDAMVTDGDNSNDAFVPGQIDDSSPFATFTMHSNDFAEYERDFVNGSFEEGTLKGWTRTGDGRVITMLGSTYPTDGMYMGIISTGLGFTVSSGSITASICSPVDSPGGKTLKFDWNFFSEEFLEWCQSQYQDFFEVVIAIDGGSQTSIMYYHVDDLCGSVTQSDVYFDQGDVYDTGWQTASFTLPAMSQGQSLTIFFRAGDIGDSIYDTAILLDNIRIE